MSTNPNPRRMSEVRGPLLKRLSKSEDSVTRLSVALDIECPSEALEELQKDLDDRVRKAASITLEAKGLLEVVHLTDDPTRLRELAEHKHPDIRKRVARNTSCPPEILGVLKSDPNEGVRIEARKAHPPPLMG